MDTPCGAKAGGLVGREDELASLQALLDDVEAGGASLVIHGDPGIGKVGPHLPSYAARIFAISIFFICSIAFIPRWDFSEFGSLIRARHCRYEG